MHKYIRYEQEEDSSVIMIEDPSTEKFSPFQNIQFGKSASKYRLPSIDPARSITGVVTTRETELNVHGMMGERRFSYNDVVETMQRNQCLANLISGEVRDIKLTGLHYQPSPASFQYRRVQSFEHSIVQSSDQHLPSPSLSNQWEDVSYTKNSKPSFQNSTSTSNPRKLHTKKSGKRIFKPCKIEGCSKSIASRGLCTRHGGGKRCTISQCNKVAVSRGLCRGHGGGRRCQQDHCKKSAQSDSVFCWGHGGGKRCSVGGCMSSTKANGLCALHFRENQPHRY